METTIQISKDLLEELKKRKINNKESYENIIWDLLEDTMELSEQTKKDIQEAREQIEKGDYVTLEELKKELDL
jgi:predicted transcriptional regulator